jgi:GWxTD domain-containing protein
MDYSFMTSNTRKLFFYLFMGGLLLSNFRLNAQMRREVPDSGMENLVSFESNLMAGDSTTVRVDIVFRVRYDFFVFTHPFNSPPNQFNAKGELGVEVLDANDTPVARDIKTVQLQSETSNSASLKNNYYQGGTTFSLAPGTYKLIYHVDDKQSERHFRDDHQMLVVSSFNKKSTAQSSAIFVTPISQPSSKSTFALFNLGSGTYLGKNTGLLLGVAHQDSATAIHYEISQIGNSENPHMRFNEASREEDKKETSLEQNDTTLNAAFFPQLDVSLDCDSSQTVSYRFVPHRGSNWIYGVLHTEQLPQGHYILKIHFAGNDTTTVRQPFTVRWLDMPLSLTNLDFAVKAMQYITTDSEYDRLQSGNRTARIKAFEDFWKQRDPTPATAYNEMMAEYFRRVDYTETAFRTLKEENGALTDRGKIYILNGAPSHIERLLQPNSVPKEIWTYASLKKKFYFEDPSRQGNYKLVLAEQK